MSFFALWHPLRKEDDHTALVFGFLRHAPVEAALGPWLTDVLGRSVSPPPLLPEDFWPRYPSLDEQTSATVPDLVFETDDGLTVIIEAKVGAGEHYVQQLSREAVDVAAAGHDRLAIVLVGTDLGESTEASAWEPEVVAALTDHGLDHVKATLYYASWASLGRQIKICRDSSHWGRYADDVLWQLRLNGLLDYDGAPVFEDLEGRLTVVNAVEADTRFVAAGFSSSSIMQRDGTSRSLNADEGSFEATILLSPYTSPGCPDGVGVYVAVWLTPEDGEHARLQAGIYHRWGGEALVWQYAGAGLAEQPRTEAMTRVDPSMLPTVNHGRDSDWVLDEIPWQPGDGPSDVRWVLDRGAEVWRDAP